MRQAIHQTTGSRIGEARVAADLFIQLRHRAAAVLARITAQRDAAAMRDTLAELSEAQRRDIGVDAVASIPTVVVDGALMRRLMAMR
ncbi:hypothetical protein [Falsiroseomonas sp. E2-1-a20]|uniref:hypothetical protein n=1 Tax=Falsiroseomonas sp. E2-1-a20 TaxID=3239300 RepID=UPI003F30E9B1